METKECPFCAEEIRLDAKKCRYCGEYLDEETKKQKEAPQQIEIKKKSDPLLTILIILSIIALVIMIFGF